MSEDPYRNVPAAKALLVELGAPVGETDLDFWRRKASENARRAAELEAENYRLRHLLDDVSELLEGAGL